MVNLRKGHEVKRRLLQNIKSQNKKALGIIGIYMVEEKIINQKNEPDDFS